MRSTLIVAALAGSAVANVLPKRQEIEFDQFDAAEVPDVTSPPVSGNEGVLEYNAPAAAAAASSDPVTTDAATSKMKRDTNDCKPEPKGYAPTTSPDTDRDFAADPQYASIANAAAIPDGYSLAFSGLSGGTESPTYITYKTLQSYDPIACQQFCDSVDSCYYFNLFIERDPTITPADACLNPGSLSQYKCSLFGAQQTSKTATNVGQWRRDFHVLIGGSNGYNKLAAPASQPSFTGPTELSGAINAPDNSYIGYKYYPGAYNPAQCASSCLATTQYNQKHPKADGSYNTCSFFNSYVLSKNGSPQGTYCSMYTNTWSKSYATNFGQYRGSDRYTVSQSYGWVLNQGE